MVDLYRYVAVGLTPFPGALYTVRWSVFLVALCGMLSQEGCPLQPAERFSGKAFCRLQRTIDKAIAEAVEDAKKDGIHGKATTPYLLAKIKDLTGGDSLDSNIQLVFNNARLGAAAAVELSKLEK